MAYINLLNLLTLTSYFVHWIDFRGFYVGKLNYELKARYNQSRHELVPAILGLKLKTPCSASQELIHYTIAALYTCIVQSYTPFTTYFREICTESVMNPNFK